MRELYFQLVIPLLALLVPLTLQAQSTDSPSAAQLSLGPAIHQYLAQPNGLEILSDKVGDVVLTDEPEQWSQHSLQSLSRTSSMVVVGTVTNKTSSLTPRGDSITTAYGISASQTLKGALKDKLTIHVVGGQVALANGHKATLHTPISDELQLGGTYILFLTRDNNGAFVPVHAFQGALYLNSDTLTVNVLQPKRYADTALAKELSGKSILDVKQEIKNDLDIPPQQ